MKKVKSQEREEQRQGCAALRRTRFSKDCNADKLGGQTDEIDKREPGKSDKELGEFRLMFFQVPAESSALELACNAHCSRIHTHHHLDDANRRRPWCEEFALEDHLDLTHQSTAQHGAFPPRKTPHNHSLPVPFHPILFPPIQPQRYPESNRRSHKPTYADP